MTLNIKEKPGLVAHTSNSSTWEMKVEELGFHGQPGLHKTLEASKRIMEKIRETRGSFVNVSHEFSQLLQALPTEPWLLFKGVFQLSAPFIGCCLSPPVCL